MAKYHLYIRAIPGYPGYYATVDGDILKKRGNSLFKLTLPKFIMVIILLKLYTELRFMG